MSNGLLPGTVGKAEAMGSGNKLSLLLRARALPVETRRGRGICRGVVGVYARS